MIAFPSTYAAILAQKLLRPEVPIQTMPVLREVSQGCGIAVRFRPEDLERVRAVLARSSLKGEEYALYAVTGQGDLVRARPLAPSQAAEQGSQ